MSRKGVKNVGLLKDKNEIALWNDSPVRNCVFIISGERGMRAEHGAALKAHSCFYIGVRVIELVEIQFVMCLE